MRSTEHEILKMLGRTFEVASPKRTKKLSFADSTETIPQLPSDSTNPRIKINVGGVIYEIRKHTLERYPETLLGNPQRRNRYFDETRKELFFERNQIVFNAILNFYIKKGELRRPQNVSIEAFFEEIRFFDLGELALKRWFKREKLFENQLVLPKDPSRLRLWKFLEDPSSSFGAKIFALVNFIVTFLAVTANCVETVPGVQGKISNRFTGSSSNNTTGDGIAQSSKFARFYKTFDVFFGIDLVCVIFFTLELSLRFIVSPIKKRFFLQGKNLIDLLSIIPFFVEVIYMYVGISAESLHSSMTLLSQLRVIRLLRVVRVLKFTQQFRGVRILVETVIASMWEIGLLTMILLICTLIFSAAVYYAEASEKDTQFISIPGSFYWSVVSMTSVSHHTLGMKGHYVLT